MKCRQDEEKLKSKVNPLNFGIQPILVTLYLVVVNLAHPRARHGLRQQLGGPRLVQPQNKPQAHAQQKDTAGHSKLSQKNISHSRWFQTESPQKKINKRGNNRRKICDVAQGNTPWKSWIFPPLHLTRGYATDSRIARAPIGKLKQTQGPETMEITSAVKPLYTATAQSHCACSICTMTTWKCIKTLALAGFA